MIQHDNPATEPPTPPQPRYRPGDELDEISREVTETRDRLEISSAESMPPAPPDDLSAAARYSRTAEADVMRQALARAGTSTLGDFLRESASGSEIPAPPPPERPDVDVESKARATLDLARLDASDAGGVPISFVLEPDAAASLGTTLFGTTGTGRVQTAQALSAVLSTHIHELANQRARHVDIDPWAAHIANLQAAS